MINYKTIIHIIGILLLIEAAMFFGCSGISLYFAEGDAIHFALSAAITALAGALLFRYGKGGDKQLGRRDGYVLVSFSWVAFALFGMLPYLIGGDIPNLTNAFFESMAGFSTTGASILDDIESLSHGILFWRCLTQWIGGLGIILFTIALLPVFGVSGLQVFAAEASGANRTKVHPRIGITARWIWTLYLGITLLLTALLMVGDMSWFDAVCHAFSTTGTGGFSTKQASIAYYNSPYIEYIISLFMFLSGINFTLLLMFCRLKFRKVFINTELRWYFWSVIILTLIITLALYRHNSVELEEAFRQALFQVISLQTSTGFVTEDYVLWPPLLWGLLTVAMIMGACAGSTTGGMKSIRMVILAKVAKNEFKHILHPNAVLPVRVDNQVIPASTVSSVLAFGFLYLVVCVLSILLMMAMGIGFEESLGCVLSSINNTGVGLGAYGPTFSWNALPDLAKWLCSFLMLLGRLELFTILLLFTPNFWKRS